MVRGLQNGLGTTLGVIPQQTPVNPQKNQKSAPYKMVAPSEFPGPKPNHLISLCLKKWCVWKYVLLVQVQLSPGNPAIFFPVPKVWKNPRKFDITFSGWLT